MSFGLDQIQKDPQLKHFIERETQKQKFQVKCLELDALFLYTAPLVLIQCALPNDGQDQCNLEPVIFKMWDESKKLISDFLFQHLVHDLTDQCWEVCMDKPSTRLEPKTESCLVNCVQRFIDTTNFVVNRLEKTPGLRPSDADSELLS